MKQTALEWFSDKIGHNCLMGISDYNEILKQAQEMEREQIIDAYENLDFNLEDGEDYYNKTFKQQ
jgi:hypothetical protein